MNNNDLPIDLPLPDDDERWDWAWFRWLNSLAISLNTLPNFTCKMAAFTCKIEAVNDHLEKLMDGFILWDSTHKKSVDEYLANFPSKEMETEASASNMSPAPRYMLESPEEYAGNLFYWRGYLWRKRKFLITVYAGSLRRKYEVEAASYFMAIKKVEGCIPVSATYTCDEL